MPACLVALLVSLSFALAAPSHAAFHFMKVVEVFPGSAAAPEAQYIVLQMFDDDQNFVDGHNVTVANAAGTVVGTFTFADDETNGVDQDRILIATPQAVTLFSIAADLTMTAAITAAGGRVCFDAIDCVAWGNYTGSASGVGTPFSAGAGLVLGKALVRDLKGNATLEGSDDTNDSATDFDLGPPTPRNNNRQTGTTPASTCGNDVIEGLEGCDDGGTEPEDGCDEMCMVEPGTPTTTIPTSSTTTTTTTGGTTTTTLAPCPSGGAEEVLCLLDAIPPSVCADQRLPRSIKRGLAAARKQMNKAVAAPDQLAKFAGKAATKLGKALTALGKPKVRAKFTAECADALEAALMVVEDKASALAGA